MTVPCKSRHALPPQHMRCSVLTQAHTATTPYCASSCPQVQVNRMSANTGVFAVDEQIRSLLDQSITRHFLNTLKDQVCLSYDSLSFLSPLSFLFAVIPEPR